MEKYRSQRRRLLVLLMAWAASFYLVAIFASDSLFYYAIHLLMFLLPFFVLFWPKLDILCSSAPELIKAVFGSGFAVGVALVVWQFESLSDKALFGFVVPFFQVALLLVAIQVFVNLVGRLPKGDGPDFYASPLSDRLFAFIFFLAAFVIPVYFYHTVLGVTGIGAPEGV